MCVYITPVYYFGSPIPQEADYTIEETFNRLLDSARRFGEEAAKAEAEAEAVTPSALKNTVVLEGKRFCHSGIGGIKQTEKVGVTQPGQGEGVPKTADGVGDGRSGREERSVAGTEAAGTKHGLGLSLGLTLRKFVEDELLAAKARDGDGVRGKRSHRGGGGGGDAGSRAGVGGLADLGEKGMRILRWHMANIELSAGVR